MEYCPIEYDWNFRKRMGDEILLTLLMVLDALVALVLIASVLGQEAKRSCRRFGYRLFE